MTTRTQLHPLCFRPVYKDYIWGGDRIIGLYGRGEPPGIYAESWEVSDRAEGMSVVSKGPLAGRTLHELVREFGAEILGARVRATAFPLLIKLIDSRERLSVQVHPNDESAKRYGGEAKTEMWYVLAAEPGAGVFAGFRSGVGEREFDEAARSKRFEDLLNFVPVAKGEAVFVPGGRVHAIDAGCLLLEVQQNSNTIYRIHDWDRVGRDGRPRPLHLAEARRVIAWGDAGRAKVEPLLLEKSGLAERWEILQSPYFRLERLALGGPWTLRGDGGAFQILFVASGRVRVEAGGVPEILGAGTSCLVPACLRECGVGPADAAAEVLRITVP
jgi:mannose-6-phosphate isomerase